jgi:monoamine oxidase
LYSGKHLRRPTGELPRVAVVGAGLGGLTAACLLAQAGCPATVFDAACAIGGRVRTDFGTIEPGLVCELGGEFIDSTHHDMLLARLFDLSLIDTLGPSEAALETTYFFEGRVRSEAEVLVAYAEAAALIAHDKARLSHAVSRNRHTLVDVEFDRISLAQYIERLPMASWLRKLIETAYVAEYGLDPGEQSCLNLLCTIGTNTTRRFHLFGDSDERYKICDRAALVTAGLAERIGSDVRLEHRLERLQRSGLCYRPSFATPGPTLVVDADIVVLALPFTLLRRVDTGDLFPAPKLAAVRDLGYGENAKLLIGNTSRFWRTQGRDGGLYTDLPLQTGWDASRLRRGARGLTFYLGGAGGLMLGQGSEQEHAARLCALAEPSMPGLSARRTGSAARVHWPSERHALGSYSCYRPGQWTGIAGIEAEAVNRVYFAGEHCSAAYQGFMNGAVQSGRLAALEVLAAVTGWNSQTKQTLA